MLQLKQLVSDLSPQFWLEAPNTWRRTRWPEMHPNPRSFTSSLKVTLLPPGGCSSEFGETSRDSLARNEANAYYVEHPSLLGWTKAC